MDYQRRQQQLEIEQAEDKEAAIAALQDMYAAGDAGDLSAPRTRKYLHAVMPQIVEHIKAVQAKPARGTSAAYLKWVSAIDAEAATLLTMQIVLPPCMNASEHTNNSQLVQLATAIGRAVILEVRVKEAETINPVYMNKVHEQVKERGSSDQRFIGNVYRRALRGLSVDYDADRTTALQVGKYFVNALCECGVIELVRSVANRGSMDYYRVHPDIAEYLTDYDMADVAMAVATSPSPMICPPDEFTDTTDGGYLSTRRKVVMPALRLNHAIRDNFKHKLRAEFTAENMPKVFKTLNAIQNVAFSVHEPTRKLLEAIWESGGGVMGIPKKYPPKRPDFPFSDTWNKATATEAELDIFAMWKLRVVDYYEQLAKWRSHAIAVHATLKHFSKLDGPLWFPAYFDRRGRWYYRGSPNPQGTDPVKAMLHFNDKKPLGKRGIFWLHVHVANCFGFDKARFVERAAWTQQNWDVIQNALKDPLAHFEVWGDTSPMMMYSAAYELNAALSSPIPELYCTGLPIHMDATCSGLQHFSALLRDPIGGKYVNLFDAEGIGPKQDIYTKVAENALQAMQLDLSSSNAITAACAAWWIEHGISRSMAKSPVMTYVYGVTAFTAASRILVNLMEEGTALPEHIRPVDLGNYAAKALFEGVARTVPSAAEAMRWLKAMVVKQPVGVPVRWHTPNGFKVYHDAVDYNIEKIFVRSAGLVTTKIRTQALGTTNSRKSANGISPNFIHALDGTHAAMVIERMTDSSRSIVSIHDSFGTHPCDVDFMQQQIRESFVEMYADSNILQAWADETGLGGTAPTQGKLDIKQVLTSEFFFC